MQASLILPPEANLTAGDNPIYIGNLSIGELIAVNWTIIFNTTGVFTLYVNASGYRADTGLPVVEIGAIQVTARKIKLLSPTNGSYGVNTVPLTFFIIEPASWLAYNLNGEANITIGGNTTLTDLPDGTHYLNLYGNLTLMEIESDKVCFTIDTTYPNITNVSQYPPKETVQADDRVKVNASVTDNLRVKQVTLNYTSGNGTWISVEMENLVEDVWNATIQSFPFGTNITYSIVALDYANNTITTEELGYELEYNIIPEMPTLTFSASLLLITICAILINHLSRKHNVFRHARK